MRPTRNLRKLQLSGSRRVAELKYYALVHLMEEEQVRSGKELEADAMLLTMELDNLWVGMARSLFLSTAYGAVDGTGKKVALGVPRARTPDEALAYAIKRCKGTVYKDKGPSGPWAPLDEPPWWNTKTLLEALKELSPSNYEQVSTALGVAPHVFTRLHMFRNFFAHRSKATRLSLDGVLRKLPPAADGTPHGALASRLTARGEARPQPLILDWLDDVRDTIDLLV